MRVQIIEQYDHGHIEEYICDQQGKYLVVAPHGGGIEPYTFVQATKLLELNNQCDFWGVRGMSNKNAYNRLHYSSNNIDLDRFEYLDSLDDNYDTCISFHGTRRDEFIVGGNSSESDRRNLIEMLSDNLPERYTYKVGKRSTELNGKHPKNIVNRRSNQNGIQLEQPFKARKDSWIKTVKTINEFLHNY